MLPRGDRIPVYFKELGGVFRDIRVTDGNGISCDLSNGIGKATDMILSRASAGGKVIFIGNGGSAGIASHQAADFLKNGGIRAITFTDASLLTCVSNDLGYEYVFERPIDMFADAGDILVAVSSSGRSENILRAVEVARKRDSGVITMSGFDPANPLHFKGEINFYVPSRSYGYVEITHLAICHCILDRIVERKAGRRATGMMNGVADVSPSVATQSEPTKKQASLSVVVPALNEEENLEGALAKIIGALEDGHVDWQIVVVNDGSTDRTGEIAEECARGYDRVRVLHHERAEGIGYCFREGVIASSKDAVILLPGDGEISADELLEWLFLLERLDLVNPFVVNRRVRSWGRRVLSALYVRIINISFKTSFKYTNGTVIYRRRVFEVVRQEANGFFYQTECLVRATRAGFSVVEVPVRLGTRRGGKSKALSVRSFWILMTEFLRLFFDLHFWCRVGRSSEPGCGPPKNAGAIEDELQ